MKRIIFLLLFLATTAHAEVVATATSTSGHRITLTTERCTVISGRSQQLQWGRTFSYLDSGITVTGCGRLDNDTVLIEWFTPEGLDIRRYDMNKFNWIKKDSR